MDNKNFRYSVHRFAIGVVLYCMVISIAVLSVKAQENADSDQNRAIMNYVKDLLLDKNAQLSQKDRNFYNAAVVVMMMQMDPDPRMEDSLMNAAWQGEMSLPLQERRSQIFQYIAIGRMLQKDKKKVREAVEMAEKYNKLTRDFNNAEYLAFKNFLLTSRIFTDDINVARRQVVEDLLILNDTVSHNVSTSKDLLTYLSGWKKVIDKKDVYLMLSYMSVFNKHNLQYLNLVGPDKYEPEFMVSLIEILSNPIAQKYVTKEQIESMYKLATDMMDSRTLTEGESITFCNLLFNKASFYLDIGNLTEAENAALKMKEVSRNVKGVMTENDKVKWGMILLDIYMKRNNLDKITELFPEFKESVESSFYNNGEFQAILLKMETILMAQKGDMDGMVVSAIKSFELSRSEIERKFPYMTAFDREIYLSGYGDPAHVLIAFLQTEPNKLAGPAYDAVLYRTGLQFRAQKKIDELLAKSRNPQTKLLSDSITQLRNFYATCDDASLIALETSVQLRKLEYRLIDLLQTETGIRDKRVTWQDVKKQLKRGEAAVEMFFANDKYTMAMVVKHDSEIPEVITVGDAVKLLNYINGAGNVSTPLQLARNIYDKSDTGLYELVWKPLDESLAGIHTVYLSTGGLLSMISFNAIATPDGEYLFDKYDIHQLTSTAEILNSHKRNPPKESIVLGDVDFYGDGLAASDTGTDSEERNAAAIDDFSERGVSRTHFKKLPFTREEIDVIKDLLPGKTTILRGKDATEKNLRAGMEGSPKLLHLATHGFFIPNVQSALKVPYMAQHQTLVSSSMQRSGLALTGAEMTWRGNASEDDKDGILTAMEVAELDLNSVQLVTLSACETALGNYSFEGVYGLPRGFKQAGAGSMLVSLWSVNDKAASRFMTEFYSKWISGKDIRGAYRHALATVRSQYPSPSLWAPFILFD